MKTIQKRLLPLLLAVALCFGHAITARAAGPAVVLVPSGTYSFKTSYSNPYGEFADGLMPVKQGGKWGYINLAGQLAIPCMFQDVEPFSEEADGIAYVTLEDGSQGFLNSAGQLFFVYNGTEYQFRGSSSGNQYPHEGLLKVYSKTTKKYGFMNMAGQLVVPCKYEKAGNFSEGRAAVYLSESGCWGFVDAAGNEVVPCRYGEVKKFSEGLAAVYNAGNAYWGFVDAAGNEVIPCQYAEVKPFKGGYAPVKVADGSGKWMLIDQAGQNVIPAGYRYEPRVKDFSLTNMPECDNNFSDNCGVVWIFDGTDYAMLYQDGRIKKAGNNNGKVFSDGVAWLDGVIRYEKPKLMDVEGNILIEATGEGYGDSFSGGYMLVKMAEGWGFIDREYRLTMFAAGVRLHKLYFSDGFVQTYSDATGKMRYGFANVTGQEVIPCTYAEVRNFSVGAAPVKNFNNKWGLVDGAGAEVLPLQYSNVEKVKGANGLFWATDDKGTSLVASSDYAAAIGIGIGN